MAQSQGIREVAWLDCPGGGQVVVDGRFAFIGHMAAPHGTSVLDVGDPRHPRIVAEIGIPPGLHSHKVRVANGVMLANRERHGGDMPDGDFVGLRIFDAANPRTPREIARWACGGTGVHRFTFDGRYAYISPEVDGYVGNIVMILDLADPSRPE
ncbi:MAG: LVIVD repeat-containing protein, partial [Acetobacteraceae bacterium]